jgi:hypothetical protein
MLVLDPSPREAQPFTRITRRSRRPLLAPCSQLRASDTIAPVRGLYRKERTDHGRQPALLHYCSAYAYSFFLFPLAQEPLFRVARVRLACWFRRPAEAIFPVAAPPYHCCRRREVHDSLLTTSAVSAEAPVRRGEADSYCSMLLAPCSLLCPDTGGSLAGKRNIRNYSVKKGGIIPSNTR